MQDKAIPVSLLAIISGVLGLMAIIFAIAWRYHYQANAAETSGPEAGVAGVAILSLIVLFLGGLLLLVALILTAIHLYQKREAQTMHDIDSAQPKDKSKRISI